MKNVASRLKDRDFICPYPTAACGSRRNPCEKCYHLKGAVNPKYLKHGGQFCFIAPKSLQRPIKYKRYYKHGAPYGERCIPATKVCGELNEIKICEPDTSPGFENELYCMQQKCLDTCAEDSTTPYITSHNIYIEQDGVFTKAPKGLVQTGDFTTRTCFLQDFSGLELHTPLDIAMFIQRIWSQIAKIFVGFLSGIALVELCVVSWLIPRKYQELDSFLRTYSAVCVPFFVLKSISLVIILIALFDWLDWAHMNLQHIWDTYVHRSVWMVTPFFLGAFIVVVCNGSGNNLIFLRYFDDNYQQPTNAQESLLMEVENWEKYSATQNILIIIGWIMLVLTRNDDLFLLHLRCMKKFDVIRKKDDNNA